MKNISHSARINTSLVVLGLLISGYVTALASVAHSTQLHNAILVEFIFFVALLAWKRFRSRTSKVKAQNLINEELLKHPLLARIRNGVEGCTLIFLVVLNIFVAIDLTAFFMAYSREFQASEQLYLLSPLTYTPIVHPAISLEFLAGAFVEAKEYDAAMPLYHEVFAIRKSLFGETNELISAFYIDMGDLETKRQNLEIAELWYRKSQEQGAFGRVLTRLGNNFRDRGQYDKAIGFYDQALEAKKKMFGKKSTHYWETAKEKIACLKLMGKPIPADIALENEAKEQSTVPLDIIAGMIFSIALSACLYGPKGYFTKLAIKRLENDSAGNAEKIEFLKAYQKKFSKNTKHIIFFPLGLEVAMELNGT